MVLLLIYITNPLNELLINASSARIKLRNYVAQDANLSDYTVA